MPAGWGYSYLDWIGAYSFASAILAALYHRDRTGSVSGSTPPRPSPASTSAGAAILDWSANGRPYRRTGNHSPHRLGGSPWDLPERRRRPVDRHRLQHPGVSGRA